MKNQKSFDPSRQDPTLRSAAQPRIAFAFPFGAQAIGPLPVELNAWVGLGDLGVPIVQVRWELVDGPSSLAKEWREGWEVRQLCLDRNAGSAEMLAWWRKALRGCELWQACLSEDTNPGRY